MGEPFQISISKDGDNQHLIGPVSTEENNGALHTLPWATEQTWSTTPVLHKRGQQPGQPVSWRNRTSCNERDFERDN